jgi:O-antigen/teichoic acid export membrane protein
MSDGLSEVCQASLMRAGSANRAARCLLLRGTFSAAAIGLVLFTKRDLVAAVAIMAAVSWTLFLSHDMFLVSRIHVPQTSGSGDFKKLLLRALPAGAAAGLAILGPNIPVIVLRKVQGDAAVGLLYPLIHLQSSGIVAIVALCQSLSSHLAHSYFTGQLSSFFRTGKKLVLRAVQLGSIAFLGAWLIGPWIVQRVYGPGYRLPLGVVLIFSGSAAIAFIGAALGCVVTATRQFRDLWPPYLLVPLVAIVASALLIPAFPGFGAPLAFVLISISTCISPLVAAVRDKRLRAYAFSNTHL